MQPITPAPRPPNILNDAQLRVLRHLRFANEPATIPDRLGTRSGDLYLLYATRFVERTLRRSGDHTYALTPKGRTYLAGLAKTT